MAADDEPYHEVYTDGSDSDTAKSAKKPKAGKTRNPKTKTVQARKPRTNAEDKKKYFTASSSIYRVFKEACVSALKKIQDEDIEADSIKSIYAMPTVAQYLGALAGMEDMTEDLLPDEWHKLCESCPMYTSHMRRCAMEFRARENLNGATHLATIETCEGFDGTKMKGSNFLVFYDHKYPDGVPDAEKSKLKTFESTSQKKKRKSESKPQDKPTVKKRKTPSKPRKTSQNKGQTREIKKPKNCAKDDDEETANAIGLLLDHEEPSNATSAKEQEHDAEDSLTSSSSIGTGLSSVSASLQSANKADDGDGGDSSAMSPDQHDIPVDPKLSQVPDLHAV